MVFYSQLRESLITLASRALGVAWRLGPTPSFPSYPRSLVVIKPCCVGDALLSTPLVAALRRAYPEARIDYALGPWSRPLIENNPHLDGLVDCPDEVGMGSGRYSWGEYRALVDRLRAGGYQAAIVLDRSPLIGLLPYFAGIRHRVGLDSKGRGFSLTTRVPVARLRHEAETYLDVARALGIFVAEPHLEFYPSPEDEQKVSEFLSSVGDSGRRLVAIHPAGGRNPGMELATKRWPAERFATVADLLQREAKAQVVLIGGPGDESIVAAVERSMVEKPLNLTGRLNWGETGALLKRCALFIGNDTGSMHLAVGTPVVAIFGPSDPRIYGPLGPQSIALWHGPEEGLPPLYRVAADARYQRLIEQVTVEEVWAAARKIL